MNSGNLATASATIILLTTGLLINRNPSAGETVTLGKDLDCLDGRPFHSRAFMDLMQLTAGASGNKTMPVPQALIVAASVILPLSPLLLNSKTTFNEGKWNALLAHALGQTASFGSTEIARHFVVAPDWRFFPSCNLSLSDCQQLAPGPYRLARDLREFENDTKNWVAFDDAENRDPVPPARREGQGFVQQSSQHAGCGFGPRRSLNRYVCIEFVVLEALQPTPEACGLVSRHDKNCTHRRVSALRYSVHVLSLPLC
jgi:hypothetical protein